MSEIDEGERAIAARLHREKPLPRAAYRGSLRRHLLSTGDSEAARPRGLRFLITAYATSGVALLAVALVGVLGAGPLAAG